jgi:hypothetical protein
MNYRNFEQLIARRNAFTMSIIKRGAEEKIRARLNGCLGKRLHLFRYLLKDKEESEPRPATPSRRKDPTIISAEIDFLPQLGAIIDMFGPGTVFYRNRMREEAKQRSRERLIKVRSNPAVGLNYHAMGLPLQKSTSMKSLNSTHELEDEAEKGRHSPDAASDDEEGDWRTAIAFYCDFVSSDRAMTLLEEKIDAWHAACIGSGMSGGEGKNANSRPPSGAIKLKRVHLDVSVSADNADPRQFCFQCPLFERFHSNLPFLCPLPLQDSRGLLPGRKVVVRPRRMSDSTRLMLEERPPSDMRPRSASVCTSRPNSRASSISIDSVVGRR